MRGLSIGLGIAFAATTASMAFADDCNNLGGNPAWTSNFGKMESAIEKGKYDDAIEYAKPLFAICQRSPALLYYTGLAMKGKGDLDRSKQYLIKASDMTSDVAVDPGMSRRIWFARYEAEFPEAAPESLQAKADAMAEQKAKYAELEKQVAEKAAADKEAAIQTDVASTMLLGKTLSNWRASMWAGVGITAAGIAATIAGSVLVVKSDKVEAKGNIDTSNSGFAVKKSYLAGWALIGAGIVATVGGTVLTGIAGSRFVRTSDELDKKQVFSFSVSPTSVAFGMEF